MGGGITNEILSYLSENTPEDGPRDIASYDLERNTYPDRAIPSNSRRSSISCDSNSSRESSSVPSIHNSIPIILCVALEVI